VRYVTSIPRGVAQYLPGPVAAALECRVVGLLDAVLPQWEVVLLSPRVVMRIVRRRWARRRHGAPYSPLTSKFVQSEARRCVMVLNPPGHQPPC